MRSMLRSGKITHSLDQRKTRAHHALMSWIQESDNAVLLEIRVVPRASKDEVAGILGNALKIRLCAPPVEGKANEALLRFLAKTLHVPLRCVELVSGQAGRNKRVRIRGLTKASVVLERLRLQDSPHLDPLPKGEEG